MESLRGKPMFCANDPRFFVIIIEHPAAYLNTLGEIHQDLYGNSPPIGCDALKQADPSNNCPAHGVTVVGANTRRIGSGALYFYCTTDTGLRKSLTSTFCRGEFAAWDCMYTYGSVGTWRLIENNLLIDSVKISFSDKNAVFCVGEFFHLIANSVE